MNLIKCEKLEKSMAELQFSIDAEAFKKAVADVFKKEGKKYAVPGFRKGKAPRSLIEKMYGADVFTYDAINELFPAAYEAAVKEAGIEPVGRPEVSVDAASETEGVTLTVKVAVMPEVKVGNYNGLTVEKTVHTVTDEAVDAELKRVQERNARELTREGAAENGDIADIDFEGFVDGVAFEGGKAEHYNLTLGSGSFIPGFEDQIVGHSAGEEFDVNVTFPEEYQAEELAGKEAVFKVVFFVLGAVMLVFGSNLLVDHGSAIATAIGIPEAIIAITMIAIGTSLPELVTTITAIVKKQSGLSAGNIIGANIIDLSLILPLSSIVSGGRLEISNQGWMLDMPACLVIVAVAIIPTLFTEKFKKWQGALMICMYAGYLAVAMTCFTA